MPATMTASLTCCGRRLVSELSRSAKKVAAALDAKGLDSHVHELPDSTRTAQDAAQALGCDVAQITKSLVFRIVECDQPILVLVSGPDRVDVAKLSRIVDGDIERARVSFVRDRTGFAIGGVPPLGHDQPLPTYMDRGLLAHELVWAAAGNPHAVFSASPTELCRAADAQIVSVVMD